MTLDMKTINCSLLLCLAIAGFVPGQGTGESTQTPPSVEPLPPPLATESSVESCLNRRYSEHNLSGTADSQQIGHVLWAVGRMPVLGTYRHIWVTTPAGTYLYNPAEHAMMLKKPDKITGAAFAITYEAELAFDAGVAYMPALLACASLWDGDDVAVVCCPQGTQVRFGVQQVNGATPEAVAHSSVRVDDPGWLPDPSTAGCNRFEQVLGRLRYTSTFAQTSLSPRQVSQILWAGYGCTPHVTYNGKIGLTVPSAYAMYYLTNAVYLADERGVWRYLNRDPNNDPATSDHRMERIGPGDVRERLREAAPSLPHAPCYVVLCLQDVYSSELYAQREVGFVAANILIQATALDLGCYFNVGLSARERERVRSILGVPEDHVPQAIVSIGPADHRSRSEVRLSLIFSSHSHDPNTPAELTIQFVEKAAAVLMEKPSYEFVFRETPPVAAAVRRLTVPEVRPGTYDIVVHCDCGLTGVNRGVVVSGSPVEVHMAMAFPKVRRR